MRTAWLISEPPSPCQSSHLTAHLVARVPDGIAAAPRLAPHLPLRGEGTGSGADDGLDGVLGDRNQPVHLLLADHQRRREEDVLDPAARDDATLGHLLEHARADLLV